MITLLNIVFLKSTDDAMLDTLQKMSGTKHEVYRESQTVTRDVERLVMANEGKVSINMTVKELPVISYNDMAFIPMCNSIVFRAGDSPIWNRNQTCLPMSWRLFSNTIIQPGKEYSLQTIPTLSSAMEFDVRKNQPDFIKMWEKRRDQASVAPEAKEAYKSAYGFTDADVERLDPDNWSDEIMAVINQRIAILNGTFDDGREDLEDDDFDPDEVGEYDEGDFMELASSAYDYDYEDNKDQLRANAEQEARWRQHSAKCYANGLISKSDLVQLDTDRPDRNLEPILVQAYIKCQGRFKQDGDFIVKPDGSLFLEDGRCLIRKDDLTREMAALEAAAKDEKSRVYTPDMREEASKERIAEELGCDPDKLNVNYDATPEEKVELDGEQIGYRAEDLLFQYLASLKTWRNIAQGDFERTVASIIAGENEGIGN